MADVFSVIKRSEVMSHIRSKNTAIERLVFKYLRNNHVYFVKHYSRAAGKPDIAKPKMKRAVFIDGDFWHGGRDYILRKNKLSPYWKEKIQKNIARDKENKKKLKGEGWEVLRVWEYELEHNQRSVLEKIKLFLNKA